MPGTLLLALVTLGTWRAAQTTVAPVAAKGTAVDTQVAVAPDARPQRLQQQARALLQDLSRQALAHVHARARGWAAGLLPHVPQGSIAASTGFARPEARHKPVPGAGGRAAQAGATMPAVWDDTGRVVGHVALPPGPLPEQRARAVVGGCAPKGRLWRVA